MLKAINDPRVFHGRNIMTPSWLGFYELKPGLYAELSTGTGIVGEKIYGVTVRNAQGSDPGKLSKLCFSQREAVKYMEEISEEVEE